MFLRTTDEIMSKSYTTHISICTLMMSLVAVVVHAPYKSPENSYCDPNVRHMGQNLQSSFCAQILYVLVRQMKWLSTKSFFIIKLVLCVLGLCFLGELQLRIVTHTKKGNFVLWILPQLLPLESHWELISGLKWGWLIAVTRNGFSVHTYVSTAFKVLKNFFFLFFSISLILCMMDFCINTKCSCCLV